MVGLGRVWHTWGAFIMSWPLSFVVALLNAVLGCVGAMVVAGIGVSWYRITSREGASGFFVLGMGLLGVLGGALIGLLVARFVAASPQATFLKGLGYAWGVSVVLLLLITAISWLAADFPPKLEGKYLEVEVELLCPTTWSTPRVKKNVFHYVSLTADEGARRQTSGSVDLAGGTLQDGRWKVSALVPLQTSSAGKSFGISLNDDHQQFLRPERIIPPKPSKKDFEWSSWQSNTTDMQGKTVPEAEAFSLRYRVRFDSSEERRAAEQAREAAKEAARQAVFEQLADDAPLREWLKYVDTNGSDRTQRAVQKIAARPHFVRELTEILQSSDREYQAHALIAIERLNPPPRDLAPALANVADQIVAEIERLKAKPVDEFSHEAEQELDVFFGKWTMAACQMHEYAGVDQLAHMQRIRSALANAGQHYALVGMEGSAAAYVGRWTGPGGPTPVGR
jgi:hypothetical protein